MQSQRYLSLGFFWPNNARRGILIAAVQNRALQISSNSTQVFTSTTQVEPGMSGGPMLTLNSNNQLTLVGQY